ncbi:hypothetical protein B0T22DRAFT_537064 [Podospora appendiculata]|uniref:T6SS Phospholipase effector Tle1-like catalytic domain-containing protein n=1 Tax=Podospora appendiculata TaxID=314037 RepID=A0AAE0XD05_9PEZI|nr:hypothetical protein B0T22DRAFT_537064 [Podospora appendiculata]
MAPPPQPGREHVARCAHKSESGVFPNAKRIIVCCDGTWNDANDRNRGPATNVSRLSGAVAHKCCSGMPQIVFYHPGAGTEESKVAQTLGGVLGLGVDQDIVESYRFICDNYNPGDEVIIIGFSRGAFTARSVAGMVCALGFLNRAGLDQLPHIFHDYQTWLDWKPNAYNAADNLMGFTLENVERVIRLQASKARTVKPGDAKPKPSPWTRADKTVEAVLADERKALYDEMAKLAAGEEKSDTRLKIAKRYREMLAEHEMSQTRWFERTDAAGVKTFEYVPVEGSVKAVGVWDTVGSLGIPKMPYRVHSRGEDEIRFEGLDVHPKIEHAFHAIALDEWRSAFNCTMWGKKNNTSTNLRQVWFPGTHCNVGGGWEDHQIATIALAWMADQLTSIGVEFSKNEMARIFYSVHPKMTVRKWGLGLLKNPNGATSYPDWLWSSAAAPYHKLRGESTDYATRTPGAYTADGKPDEPLVDPNELVHPCVRIRYHYDGLNMDDHGLWNARALTEQGYKLVRTPVKPTRPGRVPGALRTYHSVRGVVTPFVGPEEPPKPANFAEQGHAAELFVRLEQPSEYDLHQLPENPESHWAWVKEGRVPLPEEHLGMWERMYIKINDKLLVWQNDKEEKAKARKKAEEAEAERLRAANRWAITKWTSDALAPVSKAVSGVFTTAPKPTPTRARPEGVKPEYGYHDLVSWQVADVPKATTTQAVGGASKPGV